MANKQINAFTNTALADTDSLIKQSVTGLTGKTTIADLKANLDGRYQKQGVLIYVNSAPLGGEITVSSDKITADSGIRLLLSTMVSVDNDVIYEYGAQYLSVPPVNKWGGPLGQRFNVSLYSYNTEIFESTEVYISYADGDFVITTDAKLKVKEVWII